MIANLLFPKYLGRHFLQSFKSWTGGALGAPVEFPWESTFRKFSEAQPEERELIPSLKRLYISFLPNYSNTTTTTTTDFPDLGFSILQTNNFKRHKAKFKKNKRKTARKKLRNLSIAKKEKLNY